jgi:hypothetical protein
LHFFLVAIKLALIVVAMVWLRPSDEYVRSSQVSYLDAPRLAFTGHFQADVSTVNNDVRYYDVTTFQDSYQDLTTTGDGGGWNPVGTGIFRMMECRITGGQLGNHAITTPAQDPVIGMALENADDHVFGKLVDLDPQQQMVSQIWGMQLRLDGGAEKALFSGKFLPVAFTNLWKRQQTSVFMDQTLGAVYQSVLHDVVWKGAPQSKLLDALRAASANGLLAINFNVYGYGRDPVIPRYTIGRVAGVIGPYIPDEPRHFVIGRQMVAAAVQNPTAPANGVYSFQCKLHEDRKILTADFGNCLQIVNAEGGFVDNGPIVMAVLKADTSTLLKSVTAAQVAILGNVNYQQAGWYAHTAGVQDFDYSKDAWCAAHIASHPLLLLSPQPNGSYKVLVQESLGGLYVRSDAFVSRLQPGQTGAIDLYASRYGKRLQTTITFSENLGAMGGTGAGDEPLDPPVATPDIAVPQKGIVYHDHLPTDAHGKASLQFKVDFGTTPNPRGYIDGQLYGIGYQLATQPKETLAGFWNFISVLAFSPFTAPTTPTWYADIQSILTQYGNLYPIMGKHLVDLGDYASVVAHLKILRLAFSLPVEDPNHMPVTRDLSDPRRAMILHWIDNPGADGLPLKGTPVVSEAAATHAPLQAAAAPVALDLAPLQTRGKSEVMLQYQARIDAREHP